MTREEAIQIIKARFYPSHVGLITNETRENAKALRMAVEALSQPSGDLISRADAMATVQEVCDTISPVDPFTGDVFAYDVEIIEALESLPLAEPKTGEWVLVCDSEGEGDNLYRRSECGCEYGCQEYDKPNFCLDCGAKMFKKDGESK